MERTGLQTESILPIRHLVVEIPIFSTSQVVVELGSSSSKVLAWMSIQSFLPDGSSIAFVSGRYGNPHIFVGKLALGVKPRVVSDRRLTYAGWYNSTPSWSPDSDKIIFGGYDKDIDRYDVFIMNPNGSKLERLTLKTGDNESPSWSPNGQMIVFQSNRVGQSNAKGKAALFIMNRDGSGQRKLDIPLYEVQTPHWSVAQDN